MINKKIEYVYHFSNFNLIRKIELVSNKWHLLVLKQFYVKSCGELRFENLYESHHYTKETLSREFFEKFPECKNCNYEVTKFFTIS